MLKLFFCVISYMGGNLYWQKIFDLTHGTQNLYFSLIDSKNDEFYITQRVKRACKKKLGRLKLIAKLKEGP